MLVGCIKNVSGVNCYVGVLDVERTDRWVSGEALVRGSQGVARDCRDEREELCSWR